MFQQRFLNVFDYKYRTATFTRPKESINNEEFAIETLTNEIRRVNF